MLLARRNLFRDRTRFVLSVLGVAVSIGLILLLAGYRAGVDAELEPDPPLPAADVVRAGACRRGGDRHRRPGRDAPGPSRPGTHLPIRL